MTIPKLQVVLFYAVAMSFLSMTSCSNPKGDSAVGDVSSSKEVTLAVSDTVKKPGVEVVAVTDSVVSKAQECELYFVDGDRSYQLSKLGNKIKIVFKSEGYSDTESAEIVNGKIKGPVSREEFAGQELYKIKGERLNVYNPESGDYDSYSLEMTKSSCTVNAFLAK